MYNYLFRRNSIYYFRIKIPKDLQDKFSKQEFKRSLQTKNFSQAKLIVKEIASSFEYFFFMIRSNMLTNSQVSAIILSLQEQWRESLQEIYLQRMKPLDYKNIDFVSPFANIDKFVEELVLERQELRDHEINALNTILSGKQPLDYPFIADTINDHAKLSETSKDKVLYQHTYHELARNRLQFCKYREQLLKGEISLLDTQEEVSSDNVISPLHPNEPIRPEVWTLDRLQRHYIEDRKQSGYWRKNTGSETRAKNVFKYLMLYYNGSLFQDQ